MREQDVPGHNRWHPDVPAVTTVRPGAEFRPECRDWTDCQIGNNDSADDVRDIDLTVPHMLSGPIGAEGAEPGDLLVVDLLELGPVPQQTGDVSGQGWGYTGVFATFVGVSVDHDTDTNLSLDATLAYRRACLNAVEYFKKFGYSGEQACLLLGSAPTEGRISGIADIPNACCSLYVPTAIFDFDVRPTATGPTKADRGQCALTTT